LKTDHLQLIRNNCGYKLKKNKGDFMTIPPREYTIYTIDDEQVYALLDKARCAISRHDNDTTTETLVLPVNARYEDIQLRNEKGSFDVYCPNGYAFRLTQAGPSVEQPFFFYSPVIRLFSPKLSFTQAMELSRITFDQLIYHYPFNVQALYDMTANMPVTRPEAAFALARMSIFSWIALSFDSVQIALKDEAEGGSNHA
jgi:hypothetical protein